MAYTQAEKVERNRIRRLELRKKERELNPTLENPNYQELIKSEIFNNNFLKSLEIYRTQKNISEYNFFSYFSERKNKLKITGIMYLIGTNEKYILQLIKNGNENEEFLTDIISKILFNKEDLKEEDLEKFYNLNLKVEIYKNTKETNK